jgi:predicted adenine nucleotide alpha hydrolase (AANH) superfamily ATPase
LTAPSRSALSEMIPEKQKLLLHVCCAPCGTHPIRLLSGLFDVTAFFYNPNIQPESEYDLRLAEMEKLASRWHVPFFCGPYDTGLWKTAVRGRETEPEGGSRCLICYRIRLEHTAKKAVQTGCSSFATTLSISPHKKAEELNRIGFEVAQGSGCMFYPADFKKKEGFKIAGQICREEGLYRQNYCGCLFSRNRNLIQNGSRP